MNNEARIACGPGHIGIKEASTFKPNDKHKGKSTTSLATSSAVTEQRKPETGKEKKTESERSQRALYCNICTCNHNGANCKTFMEMTIADRKAIALQKGVYFNCLRKGHLVKECRTDPSLLFMNLPEENKPESPEPTQAATTLKTDIHSETDHHHSPIVPVIIHHKDSPEKTIKTYAVLDEEGF